MNRYIKFLATAAILVVVSHMAHAQPAPPANPAAVPIDGGLGLLLAAGAGLGLKKTWDQKKK